jgi:DNA topoisomerase IB
MYLDFVGKKVIKQFIDVDNEILFEWGQYFKIKNKDYETWLNITNYELTKFVKKYVGRKFVPKDMRTLRANLEAYNASQNIISTRELPKKKSEVKKEIKEICEATSEVLGNSAAICKKSYIDNRLFLYHMNKRYTI